MSSNMFILSPHYTKYHSSIVDAPLPQYLWDLFINRRHFSFSIYPALTLNIPPSSPMWNFPTNLSPPVLESSRNKTVSSHFNPELETSANAPVPKHSFTYIVVDHRKKWQEDCPHTESNPDLCNESPALYRFCLFFRQTNISIILSSIDGKYFY